MQNLSNSLCRKCVKNSDKTDYLRKKTDDPAITGFGYRGVFQYINKENRYSQRLSVVYAKLP